MFLHMGKITLFPYDFEPRDWLYCDGRLMPISENEILFTLLGNTFGGDGENTFALPDLTTINPPNCKFCIAIKGIYSDNYYEGIIGETMLSAAGPTARNVVECKGQSFAKEQAPLLMMYMGAQFGGDGVKNFNLPDMQGKSLHGLRYLMAVQGNDPHFPRESYVGELFMLPYDTDSENLLPCNGSRISSQSQAPLYRLLGTRFGGDEHQFALPDLRAAAPPKYRYYISPKGMFPSRG
jgi:microcystin-dependent protein